MRISIAAILVLYALHPAASAGSLEDGVFTVDGRPFYPLGSWNHPDTTPADIERLGMNTSFLLVPETEEGVEQFGLYMRRCNDLGIQVIPYVFYGGARVEPWSQEALSTVSKLAGEPNLLAWYIGDDVTKVHLPGIEHTARHLRRLTPGIPTVADYIEEESPEARRVFTESVDIRSQYYYPIPHDPYADYLEFFDDQRDFVGDPLWTWVQCFMWGFTGSFFDIGDIGPSPMPDPEQIRLLSFAAINRAVRGLMFFPHHSLSRMPEMSGEVALLCREVRLFDGHLAAGTPVFDLAASHEHVNATAHRYENSTVISAAILKPDYHRYVDEGIVENLQIDCPWPGGECPKALLVATPDVVECGVEPAPEDGFLRITIPRLELAGFVLLSSDPKEWDLLRSGVEGIPHSLRKLMLPAAVAQTRKVNGVLWQLGIDNLNDPSNNVRVAVQAGERCSDAIVEGRYEDAFRAWREALRSCRSVVGETMEFADSLREAIPAKQRAYLGSPYGLHRIRGLGDVPPADDPWRFNRKWMIAGPFPLEADLDDEQKMPPGFERVYPPETNTRQDARFDTLDGPSIWRFAESGVSGLLDLSQWFETTGNVVSYARCTVIAPREMDATLSIGSNDGARVWVNGTLAYSKHIPRTGLPHDDNIPVHLNEGVNPILVKVENFGRSWRLFLSIHDPEDLFSFALD